MAKRTPLRIDYVKYEALGAQILSYEIAISSYFEVLAQTNPATARRLIQALRGNSRDIPEDRFPGVKAKVEQYAVLLESNVGTATH